MMKGFSCSIRFTLFVMVGWVTDSTSMYGQTEQQPMTLYFLSDCQEPMTIEKLFVKPYRNEEARDTLFSDIIRHQPGQLFLLGDMVSKGSRKKPWLSIQHFTEVLHSQGAEIHVIPGNHEYFGCKSKGLVNYQRLFLNSPLYGYCIKVDSVAVVMINSNTKKFSVDSLKKQMNWYRKTMNTLDADARVSFIIVCTHHSPLTNSKVVEPSPFVNDSIVPRFISSPKAKLFISGHSHNLEYFESNNKHFLVAGGGGGLIQPLYPLGKRKFTDLIPQEKKPLYFYLMVKRLGSSLQISIRGLTRNFVGVKDFQVDILR